MNRFNQSPWSKVQCEMILAFLSFAEYFRPRFFLLENVRNFVSFNKGQTFRLAVASLLEMGYQVFLLIHYLLRPIAYTFYGGLNLYTQKLFAIWLGPVWNSRSRGFWCCPVQEKGVYLGCCTWRDAS
jgi:hypothetical protein